GCPRAQRLSRRTTGRGPLARRHSFSGARGGARLLDAGRRAGGGRLAERRVLGRASATGARAAPVSIARGGGARRARLPHLRCAAPAPLRGGARAGLGRGGPRLVALRNRRRPRAARRTGGPQRDGLSRTRASIAMLLLGGRLAARAPLRPPRQPGGTHRL